MAELTPNLGLFKYDEIADQNTQFSFKQALNDNWDVLDDVCGNISTAPETWVDGENWYRKWSDGWKEQGGSIAIGAQSYSWTQPTLTTNGTLGGSSFAVSGTTEYVSSSPTWKLFDKNDTTNAALQGPTVIIIIYNPTPIKITKISVGNFSQYYLCKDSAILGSNDNITYTQLGTFNNSGTAVNSFWDININPNTYYKYYKMEIQAASTYIQWRTINITAQYLGTSATLCNFPLAFTNSNYSFSFNFYGGESAYAYVSNKSTTSMTITNPSTSGTTGYWIAMGY